MYILPLGGEVTISYPPNNSKPHDMYSVHCIRLSDVVHVRVSSLYFQTDLYIQGLQNVCICYVFLGLNLHVIWLCGA
jgi:hypothetical protein